MMQMGSSSKLARQLHGSILHAKHQRCTALGRVQSSSEEFSCSFQVCSASVDAYDLIKRPTFTIFVAPTL